MNADSVRPMSWGSRADRLHLAIVLLVAALLRVAYFLLNQHNNPAFDYPVMDAGEHHVWAQQIAGTIEHRPEVYFRGPLYLYFVAFIYKLTGTSVAAVLACQHVLGVLSTGLVFLLARRLIDRAAALLAGVIAATYWPFVYFEGELLIVTLFIFLVLLALLLLARGLTNGRTSTLAGAGLVLGLAAIARPSVLIFFPAVPVLCHLSSQRPRAWVKQSLVVLLATLPAIAPVLVRNYAVGKDIVPIASSAGVNFYIGNNATSDGRTAVLPGTRSPWLGGRAEAVALAERAVGRRLKPSEVSDYYFEQGLAFISRHPGQAVALLLKKVQLFWSGAERSNNKSIYFFWGLSGLGRVPLPGFWIVAPLALLGAVVAWRDRRRMALLYLFAATYAVGVVVFFVNARFRLPVVPVLIIFAAAGGAALARAIGERRRLLAYALLFAALFVAVNFDYPRFHEGKVYARGMSYYTLAGAQLQKGRVDEALALYLRAREEMRQHPNPDDQPVLEDVYIKLGGLYRQKGDCEGVIAALAGNVVGRDERSILARALLAQCYLEKSQPGRAVTVYAEILEITPGDVQAGMGLARSYREAGDLGRSEQILRGILSRGGSVHAPAYLMLAEILRATGRLDEAIFSYQHIARIPGQEGAALMALADALVEAGDDARALDALDEARAYFPAGHPALEQKVTAIRARNATGDD